MRGQLLDSSRAGGLILGEDGKRYSFAAKDWKGAEPAVAGISVDFVEEVGVAREVYPLRAAPQVAAVRGSGEGNSVLLGWLGIACLVLCFVFPVLPLIGALGLGLVGAADAKRHNNATGLALSRVAWIGALVLVGLVVALLIWAAMFAWPLIDVILRLILLDLQRQGMTV